MSQRLTLKQRGFIKSYINNGGNGTQAALDSYETDDPNTAHAIASENLQKPTVKRAIELALERVGLSDEYIGELLREATESGLGHKATNSDSLRGIEMMLKLKGAFPSPTHKSAHLHVGFMPKVEKLNYKEAKEELIKLRRETKRFMDEAS